jgi:hypothetical protein
MAKCDYCGTSILFGGVRNGNQRFCNNKCARNAAVLAVSQNIPEGDIDRRVEEVWRGNCPKCNGLGPVDVHKFYQVWSILVMTRWSTGTQVSCRSCATKRQLGAMGFSLFCGWWGIPWGLVLTPIQITRNIVGMASGPSSSAPSADLKRLVKVNLGAQVLAANQQRSRAAAPPAVPR